MLHKAWNSKGEIHYCFPRPSIKFQGHMGQNITDFDPNWAFPDYRPVAAFKSLRFALSTVPRRFSSLFASAHVIGLWLGINQSATALDGVSAAPGKHMLHMCRKSLVINLFFRKSPDSIHLNWGGFPKCLFIASSHHHQSCIIFENGQMVAVENLASIAGHNMAAMFQLW